MDATLLNLIIITIIGIVLVIAGRLLNKKTPNYKDLPKGDLIKQFNENWESRMK